MPEQVALLLKYFPELTQQQQQHFAALKELYEYWNVRINVISRKDIDHLYERHILHSLAIAKIISFKPGTTIMDVGTGGGFPGIPLAILFPECNFYLVDSIGKKIKVVNAIIDALQLQNVRAEQIRAEDVTEKFDFIVSRAVTDLNEFYGWVKKKLRPVGFNDMPNGIVYLKGGNLEDEVKLFEKSIQLFELPDYFQESFFETKKVVSLSVTNR